MYKKTTICQKCLKVIEFTSEKLYIGKNDKGEDYYTTKCSYDDCDGETLLIPLKNKFGECPKP